MRKQLKFFVTLLLLAVSVCAWADTSTLTFTKQCGGSGTADDGVKWTITSDGSESSFDSSKGIHYGTSSAQVQYIKLSTSGISGTITKVVVNASTASGVSATASVTVGGLVFGGDPQTLSSTATDYTFSGSASGEIVVTVTKPSKAAKALYVKSVAVTYSTGGGETPSVSVPVFSPVAGEVAYNTKVTISQIDDYLITYTVDGTDPDYNSPTYGNSSNIRITNISGSTTIKAIAFDDSQNASPIVSATYTVIHPNAPTFSPASGAVEEGTTVSITADNGYRIIYTTNGDDPSYDSSVGEVYTNPITINEGTTIKAIAVNVVDASSNIGIESPIATASYTILDPNAPGTENNPYTVAQARAAIDAGTGVNGVYATGIVSAIPTAYNTQYSNVTFNLVDSEGDTEFLQAYRCGGDEAAQVAVGDVVVVYGNLTKYGSTYEFGQGCELVSLIHPTIPIITANDVTLEYDATSGEITYIVNNPIEGTTLDASCTAEWITNIVVGAESVAFTTTANEGDADRTATFTLSYEGANDKTVTVTQKHFVVDYAELPFEYDGNGSGTLPQGFTVSGLGTYGSSPAMKFDDTGDDAILKFNERPGVLSFDIKGNSFSEGTFKVQISEDGTNFTDLVTYTELGNTQSVQFDDLGENIRYIKWIYTNKASGNVALGNIKLEKYSAVPKITLAESEISKDAGAHEGTIALSYENLTITDMEDFDIQYYDDEGEEISAPDWIMAEVAKQDPNVGEGYVVSYVVDANEGAARTAYFKVYALDNEVNEVYSNLVTITQAAYVAPPTPADGNYVKVISTDDITNGQYLIVYEEGSIAFNGGLEELDAVGNTISVIIDNNTIAATTETQAAEFTIDVTAGTIKSASDYYIGQTSDANGMKSSEETAYTNTISIDEDGNADIVSEGGAYLRYNATTGQTRFRYFKSSTYTGQKAIQLYKKVETTPEYETVSISAAGMATFSSNKALDFTAVDAIHAYYVTVDNSGSLTFTRIRRIPANTGVLLRNALGEDQGAVDAINVPVLSGDAESVESNAFVAVSEEIAHLASNADGFNNYILNKKDGRLGFYRANNQKVGAGKAYLRIDESIQARDFFGFNEGEATGIENVNHETTTNGRCYNLNGQQVSGNYKGIVIVNGKKTIVK